MALKITVLQIGVSSNMKLVLVEQHSSIQGRRGPAIQHKTCIASQGRKKFFIVIAPLFHSFSG